MNLPLHDGISHLELILSGLAAQYLHNNYWIIANFLLTGFEHLVHKTWGRGQKLQMHFPNVKDEAGSS